MRQASLSDNFPYRDPTVCFLEVDQSGQVTSPPDKDVSARVRAGQSQLYAVWPGKYRSDLFLIDDIDKYERAIGLKADPERTGLHEHRHEVRWSVSTYETNPDATYIEVAVVLDCGCEIHDLRTFAAHMRDQRGWDVAITGGLGSQRTPGAQPTYHVRVRRKSLT